MAKKKAYRYPLYLLARLAAAIFGLLPRAWALAVAAWAGRMAYTLVARQRDLTLANLRFAFAGEKSEQEIRAIARGVFENLAMNLAELLQLRKIDPKNPGSLVEGMDGLETYGPLLKQGRGVVSITGHIGNWEMLGGFLFTRWPGAVLGRRIYYEPYNRWIVDLRKSVNVDTIYRDESSREILKRLAKNNVVGLVPDQDIDSIRGIFVKFFGRQAHTPVAPARVAISAEAPIVPIFLVRKNRTQYRLIIGEVITPSGSAPRDEEVRRITEDWMGQFEKMVRAYPEQWAWMHNRWKTRPAEEMMEVRSK